MHSESHGRSKYVVTGGAGFIGSHLCDRLLADSRTETVVCVENLQTGTMDNIAEALRDPRFHFVEADVRQPIALDAELTVGVDAVFHLASPASPPAYMEDPVGTMLTGAVGTLHAAQFALEHGARIVYSSTSEVYGDPMQHPQAESYWGNVNPIGPRACYDEGKRFGEALLTSMKQQHGLDAGIVRIFNTYGPRMLPTDGRIISTFADQALAGEPITVFGDGSQTRSFCYVDDLVSGLVKMMDSAEPGPINLGNPTERTVLEIAHIIRQATDASSEITFHPLPVDDPTRRRPVIDEAKEKLGWEPQVPLSEGLLKCLDWHIKRRKNAVADRVK